MNLRANTLVQKVIASFAVWFGVLLIFFFGGFTLSHPEDCGLLGCLLLIAAALLEVLNCSAREGSSANRGSSQQSGNHP